MYGNGIKQTTQTTGTGNLSLSSVAGFPTFSNVFSIGVPFYYAILDSAGSFREAGIGRLSSTTELVRARVTSKYSGTTYEVASPTAYSLSSTCTVVCTPIASSLGGALPTVDGVSTVNRLVTSAHRNIRIASGFPPTALRLYYHPLLLSTGGVINGIAINVTTATAASAVKVGVYTCNESGYPGKLLFHTSTSLDTTTSGLKTFTFTPTQFLPPGWYYTAFVCNAAGVGVSAFVSANSDTLGGGPLGTSAGNINMIEARYETVADIATLPSSASATTSGLGVAVSNIPAVFLELA